MRSSFPGGQPEFLTPTPKPFVRLDQVTGLALATSKKFRLFASQLLEALAHVHKQGDDTRTRSITDDSS